MDPNHEGILIDTADVNRELRLLWKKAMDEKTWPRQLSRLWPHQYKPLDDAAPLLFVSMNPPYTQRDERLRK